MKPGSVGGKETTKVWIQPFSYCQSTSGEDESKTKMKTSATYTTQVPTRTSRSKMYSYNPDERHDYLIIHVQFIDPML